MGTPRKPWRGLAALPTVSFGVLLWLGSVVYPQWTRVPGDTLFALRGLRVQTGRGGAAQWAPLRWLSYGIVTALATYVDMLGVARRHHPPGWLHGWPA
jgi:hypothetical protein